MDPLVGCLVSLHALRLLAVDYDSRVAIYQKTKGMTLFRNAAAWPLVKFTNDSERLCVPEEFTVHGALGNVEASRTQVRENHIATGITDADC